MQYLGGKLSAAQLQVAGWVGNVRRSLQGALDLVWGSAEDKQEEEQDEGVDGGGRFQRVVSPLRNFARRSRRSLRRLSTRSRTTVHRKAGETRPVRTPVEFTCMLKGMDSSVLLKLSNAIYSISDQELDCSSHFVTSLCTISRLTYFLVSYSHIPVFIDNDANVWNRSALGAGSLFPDEQPYQMEASKYRMLARFLSSSVVCVCVSEIKQKGKTKRHQVGVYPSMVIFGCVLLAGKNSLITRKHLTFSVVENAIRKVYYINPSTPLRLYGCAQHISIVFLCSSITSVCQSPGYFEPIIKHQQDTELKASTTSPGRYHSWPLVLKIFLLLWFSSSYLVPVVCLTCYSSVQRQANLPFFWWG